PAGRLPPAILRTGASEQARGGLDLRGFHFRQEFVDDALPSAAEEQHAAPAADIEPQVGPVVEDVFVAAYGLDVELARAHAVQILDFARDENVPGRGGRGGARAESHCGKRRARERLCGHDGSSIGRDLSIMRLTL